MKIFQNIVVGVDYSEPSKMALRQAGRIASSEGAKLVALHVVVPSEVEETGRYYTVPTDALIQAFRTEIADIVEKELGSRAAATSEAVLGIPHQELIRWTEENECDLLVLGSQGMTAHPGEVGFFAAKCVRHARVPVLLTRGQHGGSFKCIVACVDFSAATEGVIGAAARIAVDEGAELHVVHAFNPPWMRPTHVLYNLQTTEDDDYKAQYRELLGEQMESAIRSGCQSLPVEAIKQHMLEHPNPSRGIVDFLKEIQADLAVVGRSGHSGKAIKQFLIGTTAERLIHRSPCSVLTVPCTTTEK